MNLFLIILFLVLFSLLTNLFCKRHLKFFILFSILIVFCFYFFLAKIVLNIEPFFYNIQNYTSIPCENYYNLLVDSFKNYKLNIFEEVNNYDNAFLLDTSLYNKKIYLYFGLTPVLLFYLPFNLITNLYLTDKLLMFIFSFLSFILSLFLINKMTKKYKNIPNNIIILCIFLIGCCNLLPFLILISFIYQITVIMANVFLLSSFCLLYYYINVNNIKIKNIIVVFISLFLSLSVGTRPHYILFIPVFFSSIIYLQYMKSKSLKLCYKTILIFLIPCFIYGTILALYNYLRFDSIFEFGWQYQLNSHNQSEFTITLKDFIIGLKNIFFLLPNMNEQTLFSLVKTSGHRIGNEYITGVVWTCPIIFILIFIIDFLKKIYKKSINDFIFILNILIITIINMIVTCFFGMIIRYIFEFLSLMIILSVTIYMFYISDIEDKLTNFFLNTLFIFIFICSMFINISLLFCRENFWIYTTLKDTNYTTILNFLF